MSSATVTQLDQHRAASRHPDGRRLSALRKRYEALLPPILDTFFSASDDFLFKLAENNTVDSAGYFDQLRVLRRRKGELHNDILQATQSWLNSGAQALKNDADESPKESTPTFSLMDDAALDRTLAVDSFSTRAIERAGDNWLAFHERMVALTCQKELADSETPFNPASLGQLVLEQIETLDCPFKTALMLFRLFDDIAIPELLKFYDHSNTWLVEEGILPNLKLLQSSHANHAQVTAQTIAQISASLAGANLTNMPSNGVSLPMSGVNASAPVGLHPAPAGAFGSVPGGVTVAPELWQQMMQSMSSIQAQPAPAPQQLDELKSWTAAQAQTVTQQAQGTLEAGTVSLVAMLFEYILDDENLSAHMKQLLARMQIPIIKVAIIDKDFFTDPDHSARLLLNRMARSATGWRPGENIEQDTLLDGMEQIVSGLNRDFDDDLSIFDSLLDEFAELLERYQQQQAEHEAPIRQQEEEFFEEHQRLDRAQIFIDTLLDGVEVPETLQSIFTDQWYRLMHGIMAKQGESKAWKTSGRIAKELLWSLQPSVQTTQAARFSQVVPKLLEGFRDGLKAVGMSSSDIDAIVDSVQTQHALYQNSLNESIWDAQEKLDHFQAQSEQAEQVVNESIPLPVDEPVVQIKNADLSYYLDQVESLTEDQWFDIERGDGTLERGRLSMIIGSGSKYVFTNYQGEKIAERSAIGLAMAMRNEQFNLIPEDPLFDRMIDNLVDELGGATVQ